MSLVYNEQTKLTATALNNVAVAFVVAGFVAPVVGFANGLELRLGVASTTFTAVWLATGLILHLTARLILRRLKS